MNVTFPKKFHMTMKPVAGGDVAHFHFKFEIMNYGNESVAFSTSQIGMKVEGLKVSVEKSTDAKAVEPGETPTRAPRP